MLKDGRPVELAPEQLKAMYPNTPRMWPSLVPAPELSSYLPRRRAQLQYPASPDLWPEEFNHDAEYKKLEAELAATAKLYPASAASLCQPMVNSIVERVNADIRELDAAIAAGQGE